MNTNPMLPDNAIPCSTVRPGMRLVRSGLVREVERVVFMGHRGIVTLTTGERIHVNRAGTLRLYTGPESL